MNDNGRIIELLTDMLHEMREMKQEQQATNARLDKLEQQQAKTNVSVGEMRLAIVQFADKMEQLLGLEQRVVKLEVAVFK